MFGIKNDTFCERNITLPIDWKMISQLYHVENEINDKLKNEFRELRALIKGIEEKIDAMGSGNNRTKKNILKRKRRRNLHK